MSVRGVVLAALFLVAAPAGAADRRFGVTGGVSGFGALGWVGGVSAAGWVGVAGPLTLDVDFGRYTDTMDEGAWQERYTLLSGGIGARRRGGQVHPFAHVLLGTYNERVDTDYGSGHDVTEDSETMTLIGGGLDVRLGAVTLRLSVHYLHTNLDGGALRLGLGIGY